MFRVVVSCCVLFQKLSDIFRYFSRNHVGCMHCYKLDKATKNNKFRIRSSLSSFQVEKVPNPVDLDEEGKDRSFLQELFFVDPDCLKSLRHLRCFCERDLIHINSVLILRL